MKINGKRVAYWLSELEPDPNQKGRFRVCLVTENEPGYSKMGDESKGQYPWYLGPRDMRRTKQALGT